MEMQEEIPFGRRVRLKLYYSIPNRPSDMKVGDTISQVDENTFICQPSEDKERFIIPAGTEGTVNALLSCLDMYDLSKECPVELDIDDPQVPQYLSIPWELLEFINEKKEKVVDENYFL